MAHCGIIKYDQLPKRIGKVDVDWLRWRLSQSPPGSIRYSILHKLEKACKEYYK